ncbi:MAG TPA: hypothetical protein VEI02_08680 [Planctomycetota bacterium]|nr:hypothetical protein [Planctomycetota bacterium]
MKRFTLSACVCLLAAVATAQAPSNNACSNALVVFGGINPQPPSGASGQFFTNVAATNSSSTAFGVECAPAFNKDVWFLYTAVRTGPVTVRTCTPSGFTAGSLTETVVAVYDAGDCPGGGPALACNDDSFACSSSILVPSNRASVTFNAYYAKDYLIRVGTENASTSGTFYLEVDEPAAAANNTCAGATSVSTGLNSGLSVAGSTPLTSTYGCSAWSASHSDVWHTYDTGLFIGGREATITATGAGADLVSVYKGTCGTLPPTFSVTQTVACGGTQVSFALSPFSTYWIRVGLAEQIEPSGFDYDLQIDVEVSPPNDDCADGLTFLGGTLPYHPSQASFLTNVAALTTPGLSLCTTYNSDVWFDYLATTSGKVSVSTLTPSGQAPGTLTNTVLAVFSDCGATTPIACNNDFGGSLLSYLEFDAVQGQHYRVMVADFGPAQFEGTFWLAIYPKFSLTMSSPGGPGTFRLDLANGGPNHLFFTCLTLQQGAYPYGPFFGVEPTLTELQLQIASGAPPFLGALDAQGAYQFGPFAGLPSLTLYGVTLEFDLAGQIAGVSNIAAHTIP